VKLQRFLDPIRPIDHFVTDSTLFTPTSTFSNQASFAQPSQRQSSRWRNTRRGRPSAGNADEDQHPFSPELLNTLKACGSVVDRKVSAASSSVPQKRRATKQSLARTASESSASMSRAQQESPSSSSTDITMSSFSSHGGTSFDYSNSSHDQTSLFGSPPKLTSSRSVPSAPTAPSVGPSRSRPPSHRQVPYSTPPKLPISQRPVTKHPTLVDQQLRSAEKPARRNTKPNNDILPSFDFSSNTMAVSSRTRPKPTIEIPQSVQGSHRQQDQSPVGGPPASGKRLGMRPSVPVSQSTTRGKSTFSAKQKPFKSPLLRKVDNSNSGNMQASLGPHIAPSYRLLHVIQGFAHCFRE